MPPSSGKNAGVTEPTRSADPRPPDDDHREGPGAPRTSPTAYKELWVEGTDGRVRPVGEDGRVDAHDGAPTSAARWYEVRTLDDFLDAADALGVGLADQVGRGHLPVHVHHVKHHLAHVEHIGMDWLLVVAPTAAFSDEDRQVSTGSFSLLVGRTSS